MDIELEQLWGIYRHVFPGFSRNHMLAYRCLWRIEPKTAEQVAAQTGLGRATAFKMLSELMREGLVKKNGFRPVGYYASDPLRAYSISCQRLLVKLRKGREKIGSLISNSSGLGGELYLIKRDGGQQRLISKETRHAVLDEEVLRQLRSAIDAQLEQAGQQKLRAWAACR